jgi:hypothetical protein
MRILLSTVCAIIATAPLIALSPASAAASRADGLTLELHVDVPRAPDAPQVEVTAVIENAGTKGLSLRSRPQWLGRCGLTLQIRTPGGEAKKVPDDEGDCLNTKSREGFPLEAGNAVMVARTLDRAKHFAAPGNYVITISFTEPGGKTLVSSPVEVLIR